MSVISFVKDKPRILLVLVAVQAMSLAFLIAATLFVVNKLGGPSYLLFKIRYGSDVSGWSQGRREMLEAVDVHDPEAIIFIGDSITHQAEWSELLHDPHIKNRGVDGETTDQVLSRLDGLKKIQPRTVMLMIGINDLASRKPEQVFANIALIVKRILSDSPSSKIVIQSVLPVNNQVKFQYRSNDDVRKLNFLLIDYSRQNKFQFIDVHRVLVDQDGDLDRAYTFDGIHLNGAGYQLWVDLLRSIR